VPRLPVSVTRINRPDTPRFERSSAVKLPTLVRASLAKIAESAAGL
jgi:hypothetical protein